MKATLTKIESMIPNKDGSPINPFCQDSFLMGSQVGENLMMMMENFSDRPCKFLIFVDQISGDRFRVDFE